MGKYTEMEKECLFVKNALRVNTLSRGSITTHSEGRTDQLVHDETCSTQTDESRDWFAHTNKKNLWIKEVLEQSVNITTDWRMDI